MSDPESALAELRATMRAFPDRLAAATSRAQSMRDATVTGTSAAETVTVTATAQGQVVSVRFSATALRRLDSQTLGEHITEALNAAFEAAERLQQGGEGTSLADLENTIDEASVAFTRQMDGLLAKLEDVERSLDL
ncbi:MAG TPA: YbaB/EbfC family nucleoid-associated protein [Streptosporangiaceae bacterium]